MVHGAQDTVAQEDVEEDTVVQEEDMEVQDTEAQEDTVMASSGESMVRDKKCLTRNNFRKPSRDLSALRTRRVTKSPLRTKPCVRR